MIIVIGGAKRHHARDPGFAAVNGAPLWQQAPSLLGRSVARGIGGFTSDAPPASKPPLEHYEAFVSLIFESDGAAITSKGNGRLDGFCNNRLGV